VRSARAVRPLIPPSSAQDGHSSVEHPFPGGPRARAKVFLRQAQAAGGRGRLRDAEVGLLAACRENQAASAKPTVPLARVLGMLGDRYVAAAGAADSPVLREQLLARARHVVSLSAQVYSTALGPNASSSRAALERLAALEKGVVVATDAPQAGTDPARVDPGNEARIRHVPPAKKVPVRRGGIKAQPSRQPAISQPFTKPPDPEPGPVRQRASFEAGPELRQLSSDLARLRAQAEAVSEDPVGFRQRAEMAQAQRDRCQDLGCLRAWYGKRRRELLAEF
jgi:hypothetical protein